MENKKSKWKLILIVALIFIVGYLAGIGTFISLWYFKARTFSSYMKEPARIMNTLSKTLNLNQEQKVMIEQIVKRTQEDLLDLRHEVRPMIRKKLEKARGEIALLLNEEQRGEFNQFVEKKIARFKKMQERMKKWGERNSKRK
jgi:16S rRNA C1402 (ribose-2'-O) methylase RsmI